MAEAVINVKFATSQRLFWCRVTDGLLKRLRA
jgi:hypothetical protein